MSPSNNTSFAGTSNSYCMLFSARTPDVWCSTSSRSATFPTPQSCSSRYTLVLTAYHLSANLRTSAGTWTRAHVGHPTCGSTPTLQASRRAHSHPYMRSGTSCTTRRCLSGLSLDPPCLLATVQPPSVVPRHKEIGQQRRWLVKI